MRWSPLRSRCQDRIRQCDDLVLHVLMSTQALCPKSSKCQLFLFSQSSVTLVNCYRSLWGRTWWIIIIYFWDSVVESLLKYGYLFSQCVLDLKIGSSLGTWKGSWLFIGAIALSLLPSIVALFLWMLNSTLLTAPLFCSTNHPHFPLGIKLLWQLWPSGFLHSSTTVDHNYFGGSIILIGCMETRSMTASIVSPGLHQREPSLNFLVTLVCFLPTLSWWPLWMVFSLDSVLEHNHLVVFLASCNTPTSVGLIL